MLGDTPKPPGSDAGLLEADGHAEAGEARPDDEDPGAHRLAHLSSHRPTAFHSVFETGVIRPSSENSLRVLPTESFSS